MCDMKENIIGKFVKNLKTNRFFLLCGAAILCMIFAPSKIQLLITAAVFIAVFIFAGTVPNLRKIYKNSDFIEKIFAFVCSAMCSLSLLNSFWSTWLTYNKVGLVAKALSISSEILVLTVGIIGSLFTFFGLRYIIAWTIKIFFINIKSNSTCGKNLKKNWYLPVSFIGYLLLNAQFTLTYLNSFIIAAVFSLLTASKIEELTKKLKAIPLAVKLFSFLTAVGICLCGVDFFESNLLSAHDAKLLYEALYGSDVNSNILSTLAAVFAVISFASVYIALSFFFNYLVSLKLKVFSDIKKYEIVIYLCFAVILIAYATMAFTGSNLYYSSEAPFDAIYTSDSPAIAGDNAYFLIAHRENDLRQPLFAVFSAPFLGAAYVLSKLLYFVPDSEFILLNSVQILLMLTANLMLAKMMNLKPFLRICFMTLCCTSYTALLFSIMMEQYIMAYFWLVVFIYLFTQKNEKNPVAFLGMTNTLLTGFVFLPFIPKKGEKFTFKKYIKDIIISVLYFCVALVAFCRIDVILGLNINGLSAFIGEKLTFYDKLLQYFSFIANCFVAPDAAVNTEKFSHISWQLLPVTHINIIGVVILLVAVIGFLCSRKNKLSQVAMLWICLSFGVLCIMGWGTAENGLILYSLYFGWAFAVLIYQLVVFIGEKIKFTALAPIISAVCLCIFLFLNIPAIDKLLSFAASNYPAV